MCHVKVKPKSNLSSTQNYLSNKYEHDYVLVKKISHQILPLGQKGKASSYVAFNRMHTPPHMPNST